MRQSRRSSDRWWKIFEIIKSFPRFLFSIFDKSPWWRIKLTWYISHCVTAAIIDFCIKFAAKWRIIGDSCLKEYFNEWFSFVDEKKQRNISNIIVTVNFDDNLTTGASQDNVTIHRYCWRRHRTKYPFKSNQRNEI